MSDLQPVTTNDAKSKKRREAGSGCLIPPRPGISRYWSAQVADVNGKKVRSSRMNSGQKVRGELKTGCDPRLPESWTNITEARLLLKQLLERVANGATVGHDPTQLRYADLRQLYLDDLAKNKRKSLRRNAITNEVYTDSLTHLDPFMGYTKAGDKGVKVNQITRSMITKFENERKAAFASTGTINRALAALRRMFKLAIKNEMLTSGPVIETGAEMKPRQGFLEIEDYDRLYAAFPPYVQNLLQIGFYTAMRREEILSLRWSQLSDGMLDLGITKSGIARMVPLLDGIPETIENLRRANPQAGDNDFIYLNADGEEVGSFEKVWQNTCVRLGIKTKLCGHVTASHFSKGYDPARGLDCCAGCRAIYEWADYNNRPVEVGEYVGFIFHDLRRSGIRNLIRAGVDPTVAKAISGHEDDSVFERYNITSVKDLKEAAAKTTADLKRRREEAANNPQKPKLSAVSAKDVLLKAVND
jgi:integrase